jgi:D-alanine-D-alanine ligase-like ATP-grasp enzyme
MGCPVAGIDLMVLAVDGPEYVIIEVNEQPGLSADREHHAVKRFVDLLFPDSDR